MKKYQYGFEDRSLLTFDHELSVKEFYELVKIHGFAVGYCDSINVYYFEEGNTKIVKL